MPGENEVPPQPGPHPEGQNPPTPEAPPPGEQSAENPNPPAQNVEAGSVSSASDDGMPSENELRYEQSVKNLDYLISDLEIIVKGKMPKERAAQIQREVEATAQQVGGTDAEVQNLIKQRLDEWTEEVMGPIRAEYLNIRTTSLSDDEFEAAFKRLRSHAAVQVSQGNLEQDKWDKLTAETNQILELRQVAKRSGAIRMAQSGELVERAKGFGMTFNDDQRELLGAMEDKKKFADHLSERYHLDSDDQNVVQQGWKEFYRDTKGIFEGVFSIVEKRPHDFFDVAFNQFSVGMYFDTLINQLTGLGEEIKEDPRFKDKKVTITGSIGSMPSPGQKGRARERMFYNKTVEDNLPHAIGGTLVNRIVRYRSITEFLHNGEVITELGLGWETMSQQAARITNGEIDWLFDEEEGLVDAYNLYMMNLLQDLAANNHVVSQTIGHPDDRFHFDEQQRKTYFQLLAMSGEKDSMRLRALVRKASSASKSVTGDWWGALLSSRALLFHEDSSTFDPKLDRLIERGKINQFFGSGHSGGYEKMLGQIDFSLNLERFNVPQFLNVALYAYASRDLDPKKIPGRYSEYGKFDHTKIYDIRRWVEKALIHGRSDELADFEENNVFFKEWMKTKCVDIFLRGGWRFSAYKSFLDYRRDANGKYELDDDGNTKINFQRSIENLKKIGPYALLQMIEHEIKPDTLADMDSDTLNYVTGGNIIKDAGELKEFLMERFVFDRIAKTAPSKFLAYEERQYTPHGEALLRDNLMTYLQTTFPNFSQEFIEDHVYDLFVSSLSMAEKHTWNDRIKNEEMTQVDHQGNHVFVEEFTEADLDGIEEKLKNYFEIFKEETGIMTINANDEKISLDITGDQYFQTLKGFYRILKDEINVTHHRREDHSRGTETLSERFAHFYIKGIGTINHMIRGDDFDFKAFKMQQAGRRVTERFMGESNLVATKSNPGLHKLVNESIPGFVKHTYGGHDELGSALEQTVIAAVKEITGPVADSIDKGQADEWATYLTAFIGRIIGKDTKYRAKGIGQMREYFERNLVGSQASLATEFFKPFFGRFTTALDGDGMHVLGLKMMSALDIPKDKYKTEDYETVRVGPLRLRRPVKDSNHTNKANYEQMRKLLGDTPLARTLETRLQAVFTVLSVLILALLSEAYKKENA